MAADSSPPVWLSRLLRYRTPAVTLSDADVGLSGRPARLRCTYSHVPGITCITPRAFALDTMPLLKPLSCQAMAAASDGGTPLADATDWTAPAPTRLGVGSGAAAGTTFCAGAGGAARTGTGAPVGSLRTVPASRTPFGSRPFMAAMAFTETRAEAASPDSVSPGRTV